MNTQAGYSEETLRRQWWLFSGLGVAMIIVGIMASVGLFITSIAIQLLVGWLLIIGGLIYGAYGYGVRQHGGAITHILIAILAVIAGAALLLYPSAVIRVITLVVGAFFVVEGLAKIIASVRTRGLWSWGWGILSGIISIALAIYIFSRWPGISGWTMSVLFGIDLVLGGAVLMLFGSQLHHAPQAGGQTVARGHA